MGICVFTPADPLFQTEKRHFMGKGFSKFKRKLRIGAWVRALLLGLSLGTVTLAVLWLKDKLTAAEPDFVAYCLIAGAVTAAAFLAALPVLLPTKKQIAKRIDRHLALGEKVQTMIAFSNDPGEMAALQRADTDRILTETPKRRVKGVCTWLFVLLPAVACLALGGTLLIPAKEPPAPPPVVDSNFSMTPWQEQALKDLIEKVKASDMEEIPKEGTVKQLESLLIKLRSIKKEPAMKEAVISCIEGIHKTVSDHNTYDTLAFALFASPSDAVQDLGGAVNSLKALLLGEWMNTVGETLAADPSAAATLSTGISQALTLSHVEPSNELYAALNTLAESLAVVTPDTSAEDVRTLLAEAEEVLNTAVYTQATNEEVENDTIYALLSIFGIKASEVPEHVFNDPDDPRGEDDYDPDDDPDRIHSGGLGSGNMIFGSNDTVYDPDREAYVTYGDVINEYFARITEMLADGGLTPEMEEALSDYFAFLFNGSRNKDSD